MAEHTYIALLISGVGGLGSKPRQEDEKHAPEPDSFGKWRTLARHSAASRPGNCPRQENYISTMSCCGLHPFRALGNWLLPGKKKRAKVTPEGTVQPEVAT